MRLHRSLPFVLAVTLTAWSMHASAQSFAAVVSPPRFELTLRPGEVSRQIVEITNADMGSATYRIRTADWTLAPDGSVAFTNELEADSCRPWVAIERHEITIPPGGRSRYRFEIEPPADAPAGECRFAVLIEGEDQPLRTEGGLQIPVSGRIGVIVYAALGGAKPDLEIVPAGTAVVNGRRLPSLQVTNSGNAHGRIGGFLSGTDAAGRRLEFTPSTLPILPGQTRLIEMTASIAGAEVAEISYPVRIRGQIEWGTSERIPFDHTYDQ